jgi:hypothetical protein
MENRGCENGGGMPVANSLDQMIEIADATGGDHRNTHGISNGAGQRYIDSRLWFRPDPSR